MGVERAVTRWLVQRETLLSTENELQQQRSQLTEDQALSPALVEIEEAIKKTQEQLRLLGPCPRPMMG
jgi:hypothetical protein